MFIMRMQQAKKGSKKPSAIQNLSGSVRTLGMLGVRGPVKNADFYDIGVYVLDNQIEVIEQYDYEITKFAPDGIVVKVKIPDDADSDDVLYVAAYNEQKELVKAYVVNDIQEVNSFETPEGASEVRAFIWDKFMKPLVIK